MGRTNNALTLTRNLIILEKNGDQMLLVNTMHPRPLFISSGGKYIKNFLNSIRDLKTPENIKTAFPEDAELLQMMMDHRIVIPAVDQEKGRDRAEIAVDKAAIDDKNEMSLYLLLSQSCNLGCIYCLNGTKTYQKNKNLKMDPAIAYKSLEKCLERLNPKGKLEVVFFGGEPLLNWPLAKDIITHWENHLRNQHPDKEIRFHLTSNLTIMPPDLIEWAKKYRITFLCDIDGPAAVHDECRPYVNGNPSHARIVKNIKRLAAAGLKVALRSTITAKNHDVLPEIARHHKALGGIGSAFVPVNPVNSDEDILPAALFPSVDRMIDGLVDVYESRVWETQDLFPFNVYAGHINAGDRTVMGCGAPYGNTPVVDVNGDVYPCIYLVGIRRFYLGNILNESYPDKQILEGMMDRLHVDHMDECKGCEWRYLCGGSCPVGKLTVLENPRADRETVNYCHRIRCDYTRKIIELLLWDMAKTAEKSVQERMPSKVSVAIDNTINC